MLHDDELNDNKETGCIKYVPMAAMDDSSVSKSRMWSSNDCYFYWCCHFVCAVFTLIGNRQLINPVSYLNVW